MTEPLIDEYHGIGGRYETGADGMRRLIERTRPLGEIDPPAAADPAPAEVQQSQE